MSTRSLMTRLARLEAQGDTDAPPLRLVHQYAGETPATALQAVGYASEEVAGRLVGFLLRVRSRVGVTRVDVT
jgi:hypothetical protein